LKIKLIFSILFVLSFHLKSQKIQIALENPKWMAFKHQLFVYGYQKNNFVVYKLHASLQKKDSLIIDLGKNSTELFLPPDADTLHNTLNFYIQKRETVQALVIKTDTAFSIKEEFKNADITKLKPFSGITEQSSVYHNDYFIVKSAIDSSGKQFYLSRYTFLPKEKNPFQYQFKWQFNFDRQYISNIHVFKTDSKAVYVFVHIATGVKQGQWVLKINAQNGLLIKSKRLNFNPELNYRYGNYVEDTLNKEILLLGQITPKNEIAANTPTLYIARFDSAFDYLQQKQFTVKITGANPKIKTKNNYLIQIPSVKTNENQSYVLEADIFRQNGNTLTYHLSSWLSFTKTEDAWELPATPLKEFPEIENFYAVKDVKDLNGKLETDTLHDNNTLFYKAPILPVKLDFRSNESHLPEWVLSKVDFKTNFIHIVQLKPNLKNYTLSKLAEMSISMEPYIQIIDEYKFLLIHKPEKNVIELQIKNR
jgi:hypothetical protein